MLERRQVEREEGVFPAVSSFVELPDGTVLEGVVADMSDTGARITGSTTGLNVGDEIQITLVVQSFQKVAYRCEVRHLDPAGAFYGIVFKSKPHPVEEEAPCLVGEPNTPPQGRRLKRCPIDGKLFPSEYLHCPFDKTDLVWQKR